ncbi:MAG: hypothetical protein HY534_04700 [Chloroflexi bacterium]|nr:hypothetical protein [Chloroflexota bacterium]
MPFEEIATIVDRSPAATRQLASRARRRIQGVSAPNRDLVRQQEIAVAFLAASRSGDFAALLALPDPDIVLRAERASNSTWPTSSPSSIRSSFEPTSTMGSLRSPPKLTGHTNLRLDRHDLQ